MSNEVVEYNSEQLKMFRDIWGAPSAPESTLKTAIAYCQAAKLDPLKKPVAIISFGGKHEIVFTLKAITTIASRAGWAGSEEIVFSDALVDIGGTRYPAYGHQTVYKVIGGQRCAFAGPKVYLVERHKNSWKMAGVMAMFQKCITSAALRLAFPEELAHVYSEEEIEQLPQEAVDNSGVDAIKAKVKGQSEELKSSIEGVKACATLQELTELAATLKEHSGLTDEEKKELWVIYQEKEKELND